MPALTTFCNPDPQALRIAQQLHRSENPTLTVLFGSRARGDYAPGRSDVDILMVQDQSPTDEQDQRVKLQAQSLSASLYRGYWVPVQVMWMPLEEFEKSRRRVNGVAARAIDHGIVLSNSSTDYGTWSRRAQTSYLIGRAKRHLNLFLDRQLKSESTDHQVGVQAFDAIRDALKAVVYAQGEWCPDLEDVDMLIDLAARADPGVRFPPRHRRGRLQPVQAGKTRPAYRAPPIKRHEPQRDGGKRPAHVAGQGGCGQGVVETK